MACHGVCPPTSLTFQYVIAETKRKKRSFFTGAFTVFLVVCFLSLLQNCVEKSPLIFLRLGEESVGEMDLVLLPTGRVADSATTREEIALSLLNQTFFDESMSGDSIVGSTPRWLLLGEVLVNQDTINFDNLDSTSASAIVMGIDSDRENQIDLGRTWDRPRLEDGHCYISRTVARELSIDLEAAIGQKVVLRIDFFDLAETMNLLETNDDGSVSITTVKNLVNSIVPDFAWDTIVDTTPLSDALQEEKDILPDVFSNVTTFQVLDALLKAGNNSTVEKLVEITLPVIQQMARIDIPLVIDDVVQEPEGKYPQDLGSTLIVEGDYLFDILKNQLQEFIYYNETTIPVPVAEGTVIIHVPIPGMKFINSQTILHRLDVTQEQIDLANMEITSIAQQIQDIRSYDAALMSIVQYSHRLDAYLGDKENLDTHLNSFSNDVSESIGVGYPVIATTPLATSLELTIYIRYFLDNVFDSVIALMVVLGMLLIYSLLLNDVESQTYEYGMLRALGMKQNSLIQILLTKALMFAIPGIAVGLFISFLLNIPLSLLITDFAALPNDFTFTSSSLLLAILVGLFMPVIANILPISRALSKTLRDSLDVYHHVVSDINVKVIRLKELGLDVWQTSLAAVLVVVGFTTFYIVPYAFIFQNISLFLTILNVILLGMLLGLCILAQMAQPYLERLVLRIMLACWNSNLRGLVRKNLAGHRNRNAKTAQMFTICLAFIVFAGAMFALQARNLNDSVKVVFGADIVVVAPTIEDSLREIEMREYLSAQQEQHIHGINGAVVEDFTFVTFPLKSADDEITNVQLANLPEFPSINNQLVGVEANYLNVAYDEYYIVSDSSARDNYPKTRTNGDNDVIADMYVNAGNALLDGETDSISIPTPISSGAWGTRLGQVESNVNDTIKHQEAQALKDAYDGYFDVVISEALRDFSGVDLNTPLKLNVEYSTTRKDHGWHGGLHYLGKARGMLIKCPGFFFSSYQASAMASSTLIRMDQYLEAYQAALQGAYVGDDSFVMPDTVPKQKLLIRCSVGASLYQREDVVNALRTFFRSDDTVVVDTLDLIDQTSEATDMMQLFFTIVGVIAMILCFFILWLSFTANVRENSWEFGVLRAVGLTSRQVLFVYMFEALSLVLACIILGTGIGIAIAASLTAQFNLFSELPFVMEFPSLLFSVMVIMSFIVAIVGSVLPARALLKQSISTTLRG